MSNNRKAIVQGKQLIIPKEYPETLQQMLSRAVQQSPDSKILFIHEDGSEQVLTYSNLLIEAERFLRGLRQRGLTNGDKVIMQIHDDAKFVITFWGCVLGGMIPVPLPLPHSAKSEEITRLFKVVQQLGEAYFVLEGKLQKAFGPLLEKLNCHIYEDIIDTERDSNWYESSPEDIAYLQFSSGSTGTPKGVMLTHYNLLCNVLQIGSALDMHSQDKTFGWMPFTHDLGLIGFHLVPLTYLCDQLKMAPEVFIKKADLWFYKIDEHKATITASPNFGLKLSLATYAQGKLKDLDLSSLKTLCNGAEPISIELVKKFNAVFQQFGFNPKAMKLVYGLAEASVGVTIPPGNEMYVAHQIDREAFAHDGKAIPSDSAHSIVFADEGPPLAGMEIQITDDQGNTLFEDEVGHVLLKGPNVTQGYYQNPEANAKLFMNGWLDTGDLGFVHNGCLTITGRCKDVIFVNGRNFYAHDVETIVFEVQGILPTTSIAVCGIYDEQTERDHVVLFIEYSGDLTEFIPLAARVKGYVNEKIGFPIDLVIPTEHMPKTSSGKVQRFKLAELYTKGEYNDRITYIKDNLSHVPINSNLRLHPETELEKTLHQIWAEVLEIEPEYLGIDDHFMQLGGNSIKAMQVLNQLEAVVGQELGQEVLIECDTIQEMATYLENLLSQKENTTSESSINQCTNDTEYDDIAIVGVAARLPQSKNIEEFWEQLRAGVDFVAPIPKERWSVQGIPTFGGCLDQIDKFDSSFFGITPEEANHMDPQQRLFLETVYELFEDAGAFQYLKTQNQIGVFVGASYNNYNELIYNGLQRQDGSFALNQTTIVGNMLNMISARVSQMFDLNGPSITMDTACSSSLVAIELACNAIRNGSCQMAVVGGVNLLTTGSTHILFAQTGALSKKGNCQVFDAEADGIAPGEGIAAILLKPLKAAQKDDDQIYGIIKGVAINNDGHSLGLMAPNPKGQYQVLQKTYSTYQIDPETIDYIEAHGTGTVIGDPVEVRALNQFFQTSSAQKHSIPIGSVKSNIGHLLAAAGIAGLIKVLLAFKNEELPPNLHLQKPHPQIKFENTCFYPVTSLKSWPRSSKPRRAGINAFGFGGTNAHLIVEEAPEQKNYSHTERPLHLITLSAKDVEDLEQMTKDLATWLQKHPDALIADVGHSRNIGREHLPYRRAILADSTETFVKKVEQMQHAQEVSGFTDGLVPKKKWGKTVFMFTGQGSQYVGMGKQLYETQPIFKQYIDQCAEILKQYLPDQLDIRQLIFAETDPEIAEAKLSQTQYCQPTTFAIDYALAQLWISWGINPDAVMGHSVGEYPAACLAGIMSLEDGLKLIAHRGRLMQSLPQGGGMLYVGTTSEEIIEKLQKYNLEIGVVNGRKNLVISGDLNNLNTLRAELEAEDIICKELKVSHAFHSRLMDPILKPFAEIVQEVTLNQPCIPFISNSTGNWADLELTDPNYWSQHIRKPVLFGPGLEQLREDRFGIFVEVGPSKTLASYTKKQFPRENILIATSLDRYATTDWDCLLENVSYLWCNGLEIDWVKFDHNYPYKKISLPTYPFKRIRHWIDEKVQNLDFAQIGSKSIETKTDQNVQTLEEDNFVFEKIIHHADSHTETLLVQLVANMLEIEPEEIDVQQNLLAMGVDSLIALRLIKRVEKILGINLYPTLLFEYQTIKDFAEYLEEHHQDESHQDLEILPLPVQDVYDLSNAQKRLWLLYKREPESAYYNIPCSAIFKGDFKPEIFEKALHLVVTRHSSLRTVFVEVDGIPKQKILPGLQIPITTQDMTHIAADKQKESAKQAMIEDLSQPFDLTEGPLMRGLIFQFNRTEYLVYLNMHHIISDGWSIGVLLKELSEAYTLLNTKQEFIFEPLQIQYVDYAAWHNQFIQSELIQSQENYWLTQLAKPLPVLELPTDNPRPAVQTFNGSIVNYTLSQIPTKKVEKVGIEENTSLFIILLAAYFELLHNLSSEKDIIVGIPTANRSVETLESLIGFFVNTLGIRVHLDEVSTYRQLLQVVKDTCLEAFKHQDYPFDVLVDKLQIERDASRSPVFSTLFVLQNEPLNIQFPEVEVQVDELISTTSKYDLLVNILPIGDNLSVNFEYNTDLFNEQTVLNFVKKYEKIIHQMVTNLDQEIRSINLLTDDEETLLAKFNDTWTEYPVQDTIHSLFYKQACHTPDQIALTHHDTVMTYAELNQRSNQIAHYLRKAGIQPNDMVGIMATRSIEMIVGVLGIIKSGAAYVPIDPNYPEERITYMLEASNIKIILTQSIHAQRIKEFTSSDTALQQMIILDQESCSEEASATVGAVLMDTILKESVANLPEINQVTDLVYVLFTSGSTGKPKGVMMPHKGVANLMHWEIDTYKLSTQDRQLQFSSLSFDVSFQEIFSTLLSGGTLILLDDDDKIPEVVTQIAEREKITVLSFPTSFFIQMASYLKGITKPPMLPDLRFIFVAGEALNAQAVKDWQKIYGTDNWIVNAYGPTEAHVVTYFNLDQLLPEEVNTVSIGKPIANTQIYILDDNLQKVSPGTKGELCIGGFNVAKGYVNNPTKTQEVFVKDPFSPIPEAMMYRTGDLARVLANGTLEFLGRKDHQVKVRGYRIELGEIENIVSKYPSIDEVAVIPRADEQGINRLVCYYTSPEEITSADLRHFIKTRLPEYMVPSYFKQLPEMPLTPNRKIDRRNLPDVDTSELVIDSIYVAPETELEKEIAQIWSSLLKIDQEKIGIHDNFFTIGGDSLLVMQVMVKLKQNHGSFESKELFKYQTISEIAQLIENSESGELKTNVTTDSKTSVSENLELESKIKTIDATSFDPTQPSGKKVLVTGATGFLGGYLLWQLLKETQAEIYCIARGKNDIEAHERILQNLNYLIEHSMLTSEEESRIITITGDLGLTNLGIDLTRYQKLCQEIDTIYHAAANVKHYGEDDEFIKANVLATENLLLFARQEKLKIFNHVSTVGVAGLKVPGNLFKEDDFLEDPYLPNIYEKTKYQAEKLIREALSAGYPCRIFRTGFIMGDSKTGKFKESIALDAMYRFIKASIQMGVVPYSEKDLIEFTPVDFCSKAIILISLNADSLGQTFHICNPNPITRNQLWKLIQEYGYYLTVLDPTFYRDNVYKLSDSPEYLDGLQKLIVYLEDFYESNTCYDTTNADKYLKIASLQWPQIDSELLHTYLDYCKRIGYLSDRAELDHQQIKKALQQIAAVNNEVIKN